MTLATPLWGLTEVQTARYWTLVDDSGLGCWPWTGQISPQGYGRWWTRREGRKVVVPAHRVGFQLVYGSTELVMDHLCHNVDLSCLGGSTCLHRRCVRPDHLAAVTPQVNGSTGRGGIHQRNKTHCPSGHSYAEHAITYERTNRGRRGTVRACGICWPAQQREAARRYDARQRALRPPRPPRVVKPKPVGVRVLNAAYREHELREVLAAPRFEVVWT